jgi:hypothetical protein
VITTASLHDDNLHHIDDMSKFITYQNQNILSSTDDNKKKINISQSRKSRAQIQYKNTVKNMNPLEILHVKHGQRICNKLSNEYINIKCLRVYITLMMIEKPFIRILFILYERKNESFPYTVFY